MLSPSWPGRENNTVEELRAQDLTELGKLGLQDVVDHFVAIVKKLETPPVLIGHR